MGFILKNVCCFVLVLISVPKFMAIDYEKEFKEMRNSDNAKYADDIFDGLKSKGQAYGSPVGILCRCVQSLHSVKDEHDFTYKGVFEGSPVEINSGIKTPLIKCLPDVTTPEQTIFYLATTPYLLVYYILKLNLSVLKRVDLPGPGQLDAAPAACDDLIIFHRAIPEDDDISTNGKASVIDKPPVQPPLNYQSPAEPPKNDKPLVQPPVDNKSAAEPPVNDEPSVQPPINDKSSANNDHPMNK